MKLDITSASVIGGRDYQEDRQISVKQKNGMLLAVMDGHIGSEVAEMISRLLPSIFSEELKKCLQAKRAIKLTFDRLNVLTCQKVAGSTLSMAWIDYQKKRIHVAILGDSPIVIKRPGKKLWISPEHNVRTNIKEREGAVQRGAHFNGNYIINPILECGLQMSRALGDAEMSKYLVREPEIFSFPAERGSVIVIATDGVFDPSHYNARTMIESAFSKDDLTARDLVGGGAHKDNATAIVCKIN